MSSSLQPWHSCARTSQFIITRWKPRQVERIVREAHSSGRPPQSGRTTWRGRARPEGGIMMPNYSLLLSAALLLTVATSPDAFAQGKPASKKVIQIESMGARAFGGTTVPMPDDATNLQACDHGFAEWFIPPGARKHPMVLVHGSSTRTYQTTFDGQPGFQSIFLADKYPVYLVDLPWT